jgi:hypothetical protein
MACQITCKQYVKDNKPAEEIEAVWVDAPKGMFDSETINIGDSKSAFQAINRGTEEKKLFDMLSNGDMRPRKIGETMPEWFPLKDLDVESLPYVDKADF